MLNKNINRFAIRKISLICSFTSLGIATLALLGWHFQIDVLKSIAPGFVSMKFNTAVCIVLVAIAHINLVFNGHEKKWHAISHFSMSLVLAISIATALQYILKIDLGIDELFYPDPKDVLTGFPGRLAPVTAASFTLLWLAYVCVHFPPIPFYRLAQSILLITGLISFQALVAYSLGIQSSFGIALHTRIALHTALCLILLVAAFLLSIARYGYMRIILAPNYTGQSVRNLITMAIFVPPLLNYLELLGRKHHFFDDNFGILFTIIGNVTFFVIFIWRNANKIYLSENKALRANSRAHLREIEKQKNLLEQKMILESSQKALEASRFKTEFLAKISHEIRTPLNGIIGMSALLGYTQLDSKQREYMKTIDASSKSLLALVNQILDISKIESGNLSVEKVVFELDSLLHSTVSILAFAAEQKGLKLVVDVDPTLPTSLIGDPLRIQQVLLNLINNAIKFSEAGTIKVRVSRTSDQNNAPLFLFEVSDEGIGIETSTINKLFKAFSQGDGSTSRKYGGTGLGLAISKQLVELMGGTIHVESIKQMGARFYFKIPLEISRVNSRHVQTIPPAMNKLSGHVLIVEDMQVNQRIIVEMLKLLGLTSAAVDSGSEALKLLTSEKFDLILMDVQMPEMEGYEVAQRIRGGEAGKIHKDTPIIAITANALSGEYEKCLQSGMNDFITKPVEIGEFNQKIVKWLSKETDTFSPFIMQSLVKLEKDRKINLIKQLTDLFCKEIPPLIKQIKTSVANGDLKSAARAAHAIKSSSGSLGAQRLYNVSAQIEKSQTTSPQNFELMIETLEQEFKLAVQKLQERGFYE